MSDKREFWFHHIKLWQASGLSQAEYARQNKLAIRKLNYYKRCFLAEQAPVKPVPLVPVTVTEPTSVPAPSLPGITLTSPGGFRIELDAGFDPKALQQVLKVLEAA